MFPVQFPSVLKSWDKLATLDFKLKCPGPILYYIHRYPQDSGLRTKNENETYSMGICCPRILHPSNSNPLLPRGDSFLGFFGGGFLLDLKSEF